MNPEAAAQSDRGAALLQEGRIEAAAACLRRAVELDPDLAEAHSNLGGALGRLGRTEEAAASFRRALQLRPDMAAACYNLGRALSDLGQPEEAVACFRRTVALAPGLAAAHDALGDALMALGLLEAARGSYGAALSLKPDSADAWNNLGHALRLLGRLDAAVDACRKAVALQPGLAGARTNLGMALLTRGDLAEGWTEYEHRLDTPEGAGARRGFAQPRWRGEAAEGRTLLIYAEQGYGDALQFCRYAPLAAARGLRVVVEAPRPLVRLLRSLNGVEAVVAHGEALPDFDLHCPMLSLPLATGTTLETIPNAAAYLGAEPAQSAAWRARLDAAGPGLRAGIAWAGNKRAAHDGRRSIGPALLGPLFDVPGVRFFSLQKDGPPRPGLVDFMAGMEDFADTAALVANLDLVIAVDTAVAHLAGALGRPVWLLSRFDAGWRWMAGRRDSPWYPTLRLYRQPAPGDWGPVVAEAAQDLHALAEAGPHAKAWPGAALHGGRAG